MSPGNASVHASGRLAEFVAQTEWDAIPREVRHEAKRALMNFFACSLGGCRDAAIDRLGAVLRAHSGKPAATVIGRAQKSDALTAASLNAASANVFDFDDTHADTIIHPTAPVAPALFALAETARLSGRQLLLAFVLGVEIECRIGEAISPGHYRRGWHITSTCGVFGAAAAIAKALALPAERVKWAIGNASAQAGGLLETLGTMAKSVSVGNAARNGYLAALYAREGVSGPDRPLEGPYGFLRVTGEAPDFESLVHGLGARWALARNTYKPYPCGVVLNPVIEACLALAQEALSVADVERVEIIGHPLLRERTDRVHPASGREAQVSAQHAVAVALSERKAGLAEFSDACALDPRLRALREKVAFVDDANYTLESATVIIRLRGGATCSRTVHAALGSTTRPLSDADLEQKLRDLVRYGRSGCAPQPLIDAVWSIETMREAGSVMALAAGLQD